MNSFPEIASVPAIAAIVYTVIDIVKTAVGGSEKFNRFIPLTAAVLGALCGLVAFFVAPEVIGTGNAVIALILGAVSGLSATGANQAVKQLTKGRGEKESE